MIWAPFLHIYQPPTQYRRVLKKIAVECYAPLVEVFERNPKAKATINIPVSLTEQLVGHGYSDLIQRLVQLAEKGQIELTGCAAYHPLLTRLPEEEVERQVKLNEEINREHFGVFKPRGFFPPEMAYSRRVGEIVLKLGYDWLLVEEVMYPGEGKVRRDVVYQLTGSKLRIFFRNRELSLAIAFGGVRTIREFKKKVKGARGYLLTAMDGETFGHHRPNAFTLLNDLYKEFESVTISDLLNLFPKQLEVEPLECTWAASGEECRRGIAYPRWDNPQSPLHSKQWELYQLALTVVGSSNFSRRAGSRFAGQFPISKQFGISGRGEVSLTTEQKKWLRARKMLDKALHSDQFWWASHRPFWHPGMVKRGAEMLLKTVNAAPGVSREERGRAKKLYDEIAKGGVKMYGKKPIVS